MGLHTCTAVARSLCVSWAFLLLRNSCISILTSRLVYLQNFTLLHWCSQRPDIAQNNQFLYHQMRSLKLKMTITSFRQGHRSGPPWVSFIIISYHLLWRPSPVAQRRHSAATDSLVGWGGTRSSAGASLSTPSAFSSQCLWRLTSYCRIADCYVCVSLKIP